MTTSSERCTSAMLFSDWFLCAHKPKFHLGRHVTSRASRDKGVERVEPCCSSMADDEQAIVLVCTSLVVLCFYIHKFYLFRQMK